jgi:hypothetical protein
VTQGLVIACLLHIPPADYPTITNKTSPHFAEALPAWPTGSGATRVRGVAPPPRHHLRRGRLPDPHRHHPRAMASLRNLAIAILRLRGWRNIAAALRRNARDATRVLPLLGITSP